MKKTTVYLPEELKASLKRVAHQEGCSEAELIRDAVRARVEEQRRPPVVALPRGIGDPTYAERVDELLAGFGED